jgi:2-C-methyl-D-erythritol 2,4-cyclodiphosphate synthase
MRVGTGYDLHRLGAGRPLRLGGVEIPGGPGLVGHSDADCVLHAISDALLGAASLGDIGQHFPDDDPAWLDADSGTLIRRVAEMVHEAGFSIVNVDCTVLAERPRLAPHREAIRARIAELLEIAEGCVGVKATTLEGIGPLGRSEAIACQAACLIQERS